MAVMGSMRMAYGKALVDLGRSNPQVVALSADVSGSDYSFLFERAYPDRFFNVGIAEQCLVDVAVGLSYAGKIPFANTFAFLFATRALEVVRTHLCYGRANVKIAGAYAGLSDSFDGPTHHSISDVAIMRSLPGMTVIVPSDCRSVERLLPQVAAWPGPVYLRLNRDEVPDLSDDGHEPVIGRAVTLREGTSVTLLCCGVMVRRSLDAAEALVNERISARVVEMHTVKPLDVECVWRAAHETRALVTVEEHSVIGGLGGAVAEAVAEECPVPVVRVGIGDRFAETGPYDVLLDRYGMSVCHIVDAARRAVHARDGVGMPAG